MAVTLIGMQGGTNNHNMFLQVLIYIYTYILVGGWATPLKSMLVSWDYSSQYMEK